MSITSGAQIIPLHLDVCHNPQGVEAFCQNLPRDQKPRLLLLSIFEDKNTEAMVQILRPHFEEILCYRLEHPRSWQQKPRHASSKLYDSWHDAWKVAKEKYGEAQRDWQLYACGSVAAAGTILEYFGAFPESGFFAPLPGRDPASSNLC